MARSVYDFEALSIEGNPAHLSTQRGKVLLIVNTASACGLTPQLAGLETLWQAYRDKGLVVVGFPSNEFGGQDPGDNAEIAAFCSRNYGVSFPMMSKVQVNDAQAHPLWQWLTKEAPGLLGSKAFCAMLDQEKILKRVKAFVLLDLIGSKNFKIDRDGQSVEKLQDIFQKAAKAIGEEERVYHYPTQAEIDQIKMQQRQRGQPPKWGITDDHNTFTNFGVPSVLLIDFDRRLPDGRQDPNFVRWWHTADDDLDEVDTNALAIAGNLVMAALPDLEAFCLSRK